MTKTQTKVKEQTSEKKDTLVSSIQKVEQQIASVDSLQKDIDSFLLGHNLIEKLSEQQVQMCKATAVTWGLNPLKREIHFIPYEVIKSEYNSHTGKWEKRKTGKYDVNIVIGYESYIKRAEDSGFLKGWKLQLFKEGQFTKKIPKKDGSTWDKKIDEYKAVLTIYRSDWDIPFEYEDWLSECMETGPLWQNKPKFMFRKTVISKGFRLCFTRELGGMPYTAEELGSGSIDGGVLIEEPPQQLPATEEQLDQLEELYMKKDKNPKGAMTKYKVKSLKELNQDEAENVIKWLKTFPDVATEDVDPDSIPETIASEPEHIQEAETVPEEPKEDPVQKQIEAEQARKKEPLPKGQLSLALALLASIRKRGIEYNVLGGDDFMTVGDYEEIKRLQSARSEG